MSSHIFVDESKERDYLLVAAVILSGDLDATRTSCEAWCCTDSTGYI